jgi:hypothetical protein
MNPSLILKSFTILFMFVACNGGQQLSPTSPTTEPGQDNQLGNELRFNWSPYIGIHVTGQALEAYREAVSTLRNFDRLKGVRIEIKPDLDPNDPVLRELSNTGVEFLGLISNEYLFARNIEQKIDKIFDDFPQIRYFQIGNEVTTILPKTGPTIGIEAYMAIFQRIYAHTQNNYSDRAILLTQSPLGSGSHGPSEMEAMVDLGLNTMNPDRVILAINVYDLDKANQYLGLLGNPLRRFRVWVTESGVRDPNLHVSWVIQNYPRLRNLLRAERVYWYTMWGGDSGPDSNFSLIRNPGNYPNYWKSPLFELLTTNP